MNPELLLTCGNVFILKPLQKARLESTLKTDRTSSDKPRIGNIAHSTATGFLNLLTKATS